MTLIPNSNNGRTQPSFNLSHAPLIAVSNTTPQEASNVAFTGFKASPLHSIADLNPSTGFAKLTDTTESFISHLEKMLSNKGSPELSLLNKQEAPILEAKKALELTSELLNTIHNDNVSTEDIALHAKEHFTQHGFAIVPLFDGKNALLFVHMTKEGITLFNPEATGARHPRTIEKGFDALTESPRIKMKLQQVLFLKNVDESLLEDLNFYTSLIEVSKKSKASSDPKILEKFAYDALPVIAKSSWESRKENTVHYKKGTTSASPYSAIKDLFYHLLMQFSSLKEDARDAYKLIKFFQKKDILLNTSLDGASLSLIDPEDLCKSALKLHEQELISKEEVDESYLIARNVAETIKKNPKAEEPPAFKLPEMPNVNAPVENSSVDPYNYTSNQPIVNSSKQNTPDIKPVLKTEELSALKIPSFENPENLLTDLKGVLGALARFTHYSAVKDSVPFVLEKCIENIPSLTNADYWNQVENKDVSEILETIFSLLSTQNTIDKARNPGSYSDPKPPSFNSDLLKWTFYAIGERLARKTQKVDLFQKSPITRKGFIDFAKNVNNASFNPKVISRFEDLLENLLPPGFNIHDPSSPASSDLLFPSFTSKKAPSSTDLFFRQYLPLDEQKNDDAICSILNESLTRDSREEGDRIPHEIKLLQQLSWFMHTNKPNYYDTNTLWSYSYKRDPFVKDFSIYALNPSTKAIDYRKQFYSFYDLDKTSVSQAHAERVPEPNYFGSETLENTSNPQALQYKLYNAEKAEVNRIWADPRDSINRFIGYFSENSINNYDLTYNYYDSTKTSWGDLAFATFLRPGRLDEQLKDTPDFINTLSKFLTEAIEQCIQEPLKSDPYSYERSSDRRKQTIEVLFLGLSIKELLKSSGSPLAEKLPNFLSLIETTIAPTAVDPDDISAMQFAKFIATMVETPEALSHPSDDLLATFIAGNSAKASGLGLKWSNLRTLASESVKNTLKNMDSDAAFRNSILNKTANLFKLSASTSTNWKSIFETTWINTSDRHLYSYFDRDARYGTMELTTYQSSLGTYYVDQGIFKITASASIRSQFVKLLEKGHLGKAINVHDLEAGEDLEYNTFKITSKSYPKDLSVKISGDSFKILRKEEGALYTFTSKEELSLSFPDLFLSHPDLTKESSRIWLSDKGFLFEKVDGEEIFISREETAVDFSRLNPGLNNLINNVEFKVEQCLMQKGEISQLNLVNQELRLGFEMLKGKLFSKEHSGYSLTLERSPLIPPMIPYIILETSKGEKRIIAAYQNESRVFDILSDGTLSPVSLADKLAYVVILGESNPKESHRILDSIANSLTRRFSEGEKAHLTQIVMLIGPSKDPSYIALKAFTILLEELIKFPTLGADQSFFTEVTKKLMLFGIALPKYLDYLNDEGNLKEYFLSKNQEIVLLQFLVRIIPGSAVETLINQLPESFVPKSFKPSLKDLGLSFLYALHPIGSIQVNDVPIIASFLPDSPETAHLKSLADAPFSLPYLKDRLECLETDKQNVGVYKPTVFSVRTGPMDAETFVDRINKYDPEKKTVIKEMLRESSSWSLPELFEGDLSIKENFATYYAIAQDSSKEELYKLRRLYEASKSLFEDTSSPEVDSFSLLLRAPDAYQTLGSLKDTLMQIKEWENFIKIKESEIKGWQGSEEPTYLWIARGIKNMSLSWQISYAHLKIRWLNLFFHSFGLIQSIQSIAKTSFQVISTVFKENITLYFYPKVIPVKSAEKGNSTLLSFAKEQLEKEEKNFTSSLSHLEAAYIKKESHDSSAPSLEGIFTDHADEKAHLQDYITLLSSSTYTPKKDLENFSSVLGGLIKNKKEQLEKIEKDLLEKLTPHLLEKTNEEILQDVTTKEVDLKSLLLLFLDGSLESFKKSTTLSREEVEKLFQDVALYLTKKTNHNQLITAEKNLARLLASQDTAEQKALFDLFVTSLQKRRSYDLTMENRSKLLFEACQGISLRDGQVAKVKLISETLLQKDKQILFEMSTGAGKTHAILPASNLETSDGERLTINIFPQAIAEGNIESNKQELGKLNIGVDGIDFQRATYMSQETLSYLHRQLLSDIENKKPLNSNSETLQSLKLHMLSIFADGKDKGSLTAEEKKQSESLRQILKLIKTAGAANIDEARATLNPFDRLIYTRKAKEPLTDKELVVLEGFFSSLFQDEKLAKILLANRHPDDLSAKDEDYKKQIAPGVASHMAEKLNISQDDEIAFMEYVLGRTNTMDAWLNAHPKKEDICLIRGLLLIVLPEVLSGHVDQNYGFSKKHRDTKGFAIPYVSSNEAKETKVAPSEFQNRHETAAKTLVSLFHEGLSTSQLTELLTKINAQYTREMALKVPAAESIALETFRKVFNVDNTTVPTDLPANFVEAQQLVIKHKPDAVLTYFKDVIAKNITTYKETIVSTNSDFLKQFSSSSSMTATPQSEKAHGKVTQFKETFGSKGFIPYHYFKNGMNISAISTENYESLIGNCKAKILEEHHNALIDAGGLFRGNKNKKVAEDLLKDFRKTRPDIEEVVYFDEEKKEFVAINKNSKGLSTPLKDSKVDPSRRFTFFDMARTVGSDIKQGATASALVLIESYTTKSDMGQAIGRMRELQYGQKVSYAISQELNDTLYGKTESSLDEKKKILYDYLLEKEDDFESRFNLAAIKQQIDADIHDLVLKAIYKADSLYEAFDIFNKDSKELVTETNLAASNLYGTVVTNTPTEEDLDRFLSTAKERIAKLHCLSKEEQTQEIASLSEYEALWRGENAIPLPKTTISSGAALNSQCDVLLEVEQQVQIEVKVSAAKHNPELWMRPVSNWSKEIKLFEKGWDSIHSIKTVSFSFFNNTKLSKFLQRCAEDHPIKFGATLVILTNLTVQAVVLSVLLLSWKIQLAVWTFFTVYNIVKVALMMRENLKTAPALFHVRDLARKEFGKSIADQLIDLDLLVTNNLSNQEPKSLVLGAQELFTYEQKPAYQMLFTLDEDKTQAILIDQNDSMFLRDILAKDRKAKTDAVNKRTRQVVLYDLRTNTIVAQGANKISEEDLKSIPKFFSYTALGKLWDRRIHFEPEELTVLQDKADLITRPLMRTICEKHILSDVPDNTLKRFYESRFGKYVCKTT